jgi:hypothetical protein
MRIRLPVMSLRSVEAASTGGSGGFSTLPDGRGSVAEAVFPRQQKWRSRVNVAAIIKDNVDLFDENYYSFYVNNVIVSTYNNEFTTRPLGDDRAEYADESVGRDRSAWGAMTGVLLGASCWGAILLFAGIIKL